MSMCFDRVCMFLCMKERKVGVRHFGHVLRKRKHMLTPFFFSMNPFSFVSQSVVHTGDGLLSCHIHSDD